MKTILIPTDFSEDALNAADYAVQLGKLNNSEIFMIHVYQVPVPLIEGQINIIISIDEFEKETKHKMKMESNRILLKWGIQPESQIILGYTVEEIIKKSTEINADLIVMGTHGSNRLMELFIGNNTTGVIHKSVIPVLAVPHNAKFSKPEKIVFAFDYHKVTGVNVFGIIKDFCNLFHSKVLILNVVNDMELPTSDIDIAVEYMEGIEHSYYFSKEKDVEKGINDFVDENNANMIAMIPHKHSMFQKIFSQNNTDKMTFHTHIPLLTLSAGETIDY